MKFPFTITRSDTEDRPWYFITWLDEELRREPSLFYRTRADAKSDAERIFRNRLKEAEEFLARHRPKADSRNLRDYDSQGNLRAGVDH